MAVKIKNENYITILGFMVNELQLKGNELLVYAIIYGFSQNKENNYTGSLQYLCEWTNSTKQGVIKNLKSLVEKDLIGKKESFFNGVKFVEYYAKEFTTIKQSLTVGGKQSLTGGIKQSLPNNIDINNTNNNIEDNNIEKVKIPYPYGIDTTDTDTVTVTTSNSNTESIKEIIDYLNTKSNKSFRSNNKETIKHINARLSEGYSVDDFKKVIDNKTTEWLNTNMDMYLRPQTLFNNKFESYLNEKPKAYNNYNKQDQQPKQESYVNPNCTYL